MILGKAVGGMAHQRRRMGSETVCRFCVRKRRAATAETQVELPPWAKSAEQTLRFRVGHYQSEKIGGVTQVDMDLPPDVSEQVGMVLDTCTGQLGYQLWRGLGSRESIDGIVDLLRAPGLKGD
ncbi:unnamed protein product [Symbiodinium microadriaticum]|nr:unnamed protein product [Symbiodinium microadriaticum]